MKLEQRGQNLWTVDNDHYLMGLHFRGRMTVVRNSEGHLWLHSPIPIDDELAGELQGLGTVKYLVGPNKYHHVYLKDAAEKYPQALVFGPPGLAKKRKDIAFHHQLEQDEGRFWPGTISFVRFGAISAFDEVIFFHHESKTIIFTDLVMNVHEINGFISKMVIQLEGCWKRPACPRLLKYSCRNKTMARADLEKMLSWQPEQIIMCHGEPIENNGTEALASIFSWLKPQLAALSATAGS